MNVAIVHRQSTPIIQLISLISPLRYFRRQWRRTMPTGVSVIRDGSGAVPANDRIWPDGGCNHLPGDLATESPHPRLNFSLIASPVNILRSILPTTSVTFVPVRLIKLSIWLFLDSYGRITQKAEHSRR